MTKQTGFREKALHGSRDATGVHGYYVEGQQMLTMF